MTPHTSPPRWLEPFHIPDRIFLTLAVLIWLASTSVAIWAWPQLPNRLPVHMNSYGLMDSYGAKNVWSVFGLTFINLLIGLMIAFVYAHPEYSNLPTTRRWQDFSQTTRQHLAMAIRHVLTMSLVWATLLLSSLQLNFLAAGFGLQLPLLTVLLFAVTGLMLVSIGAYSLILTAWMARVDAAPLLKRSSFRKE